MSSGNRPTRRQNSRLLRRGRASALGATRLRHELSMWVHGAGVPPTTAGDIVLSTYEAMANTVCHAYPPDTVGSLELRAEVEKGAIVVTVADHGCWREPDQRQSTAGRGLSIIRALCARAVVVRGAHGTTVRMSWPNPWPAV